MTIFDGKPQFWHDLLWKIKLWGGGFKNDEGLLWNLLGSMSNMIWFL